VGGEYVGRRGNVVIGWGKKGGGDEDKKREWIRRGRKSSCVGEQWIIAQEKVRIRIRKY
jgi:hypothetical protein